MSEGGPTRPAWGPAALAVTLFASGFLFGFGTGKRAVPGKAKIGVHVVGAVSSPGYYEVAAGTRVVDLLELAGGLPDARLDGLNLAETLFDGQRVEVPSAAPALPASEDSARAALQPPTEGRGPLVDLNRADRALLETLPGIGPVKAQAIVDWREANGGFGSVDDVLLVSGVGEVTLEKIRPLVTVG